MIEQLLIVRKAWIKHVVDIRFFALSVVHLSENSLLHDDVCHVVFLLDDSLSDFDFLEFSQCRMLQSKILDNNWLPSSDLISQFFEFILWLLDRNGEIIVWGNCRFGLSLTIRSMRNSQRMDLWRLFTIWVEIQLWNSNLFSIYTIKCLLGELCWLDISSNAWLVFCPLSKIFTSFEASQFGDNRWIPGVCPIYTSYSLKVTLGLVEALG